MKRGMSLVLFLSLGTGMVACSDTGSVDSLDTQQAEVVYGNDDRTDYYAASDAALRSLTHESIAAMMSPSMLDTSNPNNIGVRAYSLGDAYSLCSGERFADQPTAASCSGTLIDDDLILTAGHCVESQSDCTSQRFVFDYYMNSATQLQTITSDDVYACAELLVQQNNGSLDYAILRLDRDVVGHSPAAVSTSTSPVAYGDSVTIIGFGSGLPAKIDTGGQVINARTSTRDYFNATTDSFGGNSGSGVFNTARQVVGILVRGAEDYYNAGGCNRVAVEPADGSTTGGEGVTYAFRAVQALCDSGYPSARLCGGTTEPVCGDGVCEGTESTASCPTDCGAMCGDAACNGSETTASCPADCGVSCGDGVCNGSETSTTCAADCGSAVPADWTCNASYYNALDGCDCECGAFDPDCSVTGQQLYNCAAGQVCGADAQCETPGPIGEPEPTVPAGWRCNEEYYNALDGCDCECGAYDPDCDVDGQQLYNCAAGQICGADAQCAAPAPAGIPADWSCNEAYYDAADGCDCQCGAYDPDCDLANQVVYNCYQGQACDAGAMCVWVTDHDADVAPTPVSRDEAPSVDRTVDEPTTRAEPAPLACSSAPTRAPVPWAAMVFGTLFFWRRRR